LIRCDIEFGVAGFTGYGRDCCRGGDFVAGEGGEVGEQAVEAVDVQAVRGDASSVFVARGGRAQRLGDGTGARGLGDGTIVVVIEHRREPGAQVPLDIIGEHAEEDVGAHARRAVVKERADFEVDGLERAEGRSTRLRLL
jgi:hypothetical protein